MSELARTGPARAPELRPIAGRWCELEPLSAARHGDDLVRVAGGDDPSWTWMPYGPFADAAAHVAEIERLAGLPGAAFWAVVVEGRAGGWLSLIDWELEHGTIELAHVWLGAGLRRTPAATEAMALLLGESFDRLGARRVAWKCDARNAPSRAAALRLGFAYEGCFRRHRVVKGRNRDTAWYSLLDAEWPAASAARTAWLAPGNFAEDGAQRSPLAAFR